MITATFLSSDGETVYSVRFDGTVLPSLTCECMGFGMVGHCKHLEAVLTGGEPTKRPQAIEGFANIAAALADSSARNGYFAMLKELREIEKLEKKLKKEKHEIKAAYFRRLARGEL